MSPSFNLLQPKRQPMGYRGRKKVFDRKDRKLWPGLSWLPTKHVCYTWANRPLVHDNHLHWESRVRWYEKNLPQHLPVIIWNQRELSLIKGHKHPPGGLLDACLARLSTGSPATQALALLRNKSLTPSCGAQIWLSLYSPWHSGLARGASWAPQSCACLGLQLPRKPGRGVLGVGEDPGRRGKLPWTFGSCCEFVCWTPARNFPGKFLLIFFMQSLL